MTKKINDYAEILSKIRNEYPLLQKENNQLKIQLQKYQNYVENLPQTSYRKPIENRIITMMMILKIVKRVTLMLQKFEDVQKSKKKNNNNNNL